MGDADEAWEKHVTSHPQDYYPSIAIGGWADIRKAFLSGFDAAQDRLAEVAEVAEWRGQSLSLLREALAEFITEWEAAERQGWAIMDDSPEGREFQRSKWLARAVAVKDGSEG